MKNNIHTIAPQAYFAHELAVWLRRKWGGDALGLSRCLVLLPSRRAAAGLREAFLRASSGEPLLLPRMETLADADEDSLLLSPLAEVADLAPPPEDFAFRRLFLLARLVQAQRARLSGRREPMDQAIRLASSLAELLDELEREEISLARMAEIVPDAFASHWQLTVEFLQIVSEHWPAIAQAHRLDSPVSHRARILHALARHWRAAPPDFPVIAAGMTGGTPSATALLESIATLPQGHIVFPGLDRSADADYWDALEENHPQWGMARLLRELDCPRDEVALIGPSPDARADLLGEAMRPAALSEAWHGLNLDAKAATEGMAFILCASLQEEATVIALLLREALETPGRTAALVTLNRPLARRVAEILHRFGVTIDDSAGQKLKELPLFTLLRLTLDAAMRKLDALPLLCLLKHPLTTLGMERLECLEAARALEMAALRGTQRGRGIESLRQALLRRPEAQPQAHDLLDRLAIVMGPLLALLEKEQATLLECIDTHFACLQALSDEEEWNGPQAEALAQFINQVRAACIADGLVIEPDSYPAILEELLAGRVLRPEYGTHPRLKILSPLEARLQSFDRVVLGGLNEGSWPGQPASDPWFSRPMRASLGLPSPERNTGLAAHDFTLLAAAPCVFMTRASKEDGAPAQPSRWLVKLEMLAGGLPSAPEWLAWARVLDMPERVTRMPPPAPTPPLSARPREMSVTQVDTWMRDPYAIYASRILRLRALEPLGREPDGSDFGNAVHKALERFVRRYPEAIPEHALPELLAMGREAFEPLFATTPIEILWWPRFTRIAEWIIEQESSRRCMLKRVATEVERACSLGNFLLRGRADRIEENKQGGLGIIDYKTGQLPAPKDIESGLSNQLVLLALIAVEGGASPENIYLEYWQLLGRMDADKIEALKPEKIESYINAAREGLLRLIARFDNPDFPYYSVPIPARASRYSDYGHLARIKEWG